MPRRFGPTLGAGTVIIEKDPGKPIQPAPTGTTLYVGQVEKGMTDELNDCPTLRDYLRKCGTFYEGSEVPESAFDFYNYSGGSGRLYVVRVTDGNEVESFDKSFSRHTGVGASFVNRDSANTVRTGLLSITAKNGGRWAGAQRVYHGDYVAGTDLGETTLDTNTTMLEDEWVGATLTLDGVTTKTYTVISNDTAGVLTVASDSTMATDLAADDPTTLTYTVWLDTEEREVTATGQIAGDRKSLALLWKDGEEDPDAYFGLDIYSDQTLVRSYPNLSLDSTNKWYIGTIIGEDPDNDYVDVTVDHTGSISAANRPASWYGEYRGFSGTTLTSKVWQVASITSTNDEPGFVSYMTIPTKCVRQRLTLTFSSASAFAVTTSSGYALEAEGAITSMNGTVGTEFPGNDYIPAFMVRDGEDAFVSGDTIVIDVDPYPVDLATGDGRLEGYVYVDAGGSAIRVQIESNTPDTITFKNNPDTAPTPSQSIEDDAATTVLSASDITFPFTAAVTMQLISDEIGEESISIGSATYATIAELITALNGAATKAFFIASGDKVAISGALYTTVAANTNTGEDSFIHIVSASTEQNITAGTTVTGSTGDEFRVQAPRELMGGHDGADPADSDYLAVFNTATSLINRLVGRNVGLVKVACPGVTTATIQQAGLAYAEFRNYQYRVEIPSATTTEASAVNYINSTIGRNDYGVVSWPSYGYVVNPKGSGLVLQSLTGAIHGREAAVANNFGGYHKAAAGVSVTLPHMVKSPLGEIVIEEEVTNPQGVNVVKKLKGNFVVWGDRTISLDPGWKWKHQREYLSHIEHILLEAFDWLVFAINDRATQSTLITVFQSFFLPEWQKRALRGATFEEAVGIKIDDENNTNLTRANGDLNAEISLRLADTVERFIITIGKLGIFDQIG